MECTGSLVNTWLLAIMYVCCTLNIIASQLLHWYVPLERLTGSNPDISSLLRFQRYQLAYYKQNNIEFPSNTREKKGCFVGIAEKNGHAMTYKIITDDTHKIIYHSKKCCTLNPSALNICLDLSNGEYKASTIFLSNEKSTLPDLDPDAQKSSNLLMISDKTRQG